MSVGLLYALVTVLAVATALQFAMLGQLAARFPEFRRADDNQVIPLEGFVTGDPVPPWPVDQSSGFLVGGADPDRSSYGILVMSTVCNSCRDLARSLDATTKALALQDRLRIVVSTGRYSDGYAFLAEFGLDHYDSFIDVGGEWCRSQLRLSTAPVIVAVSSGLLQGAYTIASTSGIDTVLGLSIVHASKHQPAEPRER